MYVQATAINFLSVPTKISPGDSNPGSPEKKPRRWASGNADEGKKSREQEEEDEFRALHEKRKFSSNEPQEAQQEDEIFTPKRKRKAPALVDTVAESDENPVGPSTDNDNDEFPTQPDTPTKKPTTRPKQSRKVKNKSKNNVFFFQRFFAKFRLFQISVYFILFYFIFIYLFSLFFFIFYFFFSFLFFLFFRLSQFKKFVFFF